MYDKRRVIKSKQMSAALYLYNAADIYYICYFEKNYKKSYLADLYLLGETPIIRLKRFEK